MGRALHWLAWVLVTLLSSLVFGLALIFYAANSPAGRSWVEQNVAALTGGKIILAGLSGRFPDALRLDHLELHGDDDVWLTIDGLALDWSPRRLLERTVEIERLEAEHIVLARLPVTTDEDKPALPVAVNLRTLRVGRLDLGQAVAGQAASLAIDGKSSLSSLDRGEAELALQRLDREGAYTLRGNLNAGMISAHLSVREPAHGLISAYANFQGMDALSAEVDMDGPLAALQTRLNLTLGPLQAKLQGPIDWEHNAADVTVSAKAPAMQLRPGLSWKAVALDAKVRGPFTRPTADGSLRIDQLSAANTAVRSIAMEVQGDAGTVQVSGTLTGLRLPGPQPDLLESSPLAFQADIRLDAAQRPVAFKLKHPLIAAEGKADTATDLRTEMTVNLPNLKPFAALSGVDAQGKASLSLRTANQGETTKLDMDGTVGLTAGNPPLVGLLGNAAKIGITATLRGEDITLPRFTLDGKAITLAADGSFINRTTNFTWKLALKDLAPLLAGASGQMAAQGRLTGVLENMTVTADVNGELAAQALPRGPITAKLRLEGLPALPSGQFTVRGSLGGAPLDLAFTAKAPPDGNVQLMIDSAHWKSAKAQGNLTLPKGTDLPLGKIGLDMAHLEDLRPFLDQPLSGSVTANLETSIQGSRPIASLQLNARNAGLTGLVEVGRSTLAVTVAEPLLRPVADGHIQLDDIVAGGLAGSAQVELAGPPEALKLQVSALIQNVAGNEVKLSSAATLDANAKQANIAEWQAHWKGETLRLLAPVRLAFADGLAVDRLRLGLREAELELEGRLSPALNLTAAVRTLPVELIALLVPDPHIAGTLEAEARLSGTLEHPTGTLTIESNTLKLLTEAGRALPTPKLTATAQLAGMSAHIDTRLSAGNNATVGITGEVPYTPSGPLDLHANGALDLKLLDPWLTAQGRRLRGQVALNADLAGTLAAPRPTGTLQLTNGEVQDFAIGAHLTHLTALLQAEGGTVRLSKFEGRAGPGTVAASGAVDLLGEGMPVNLTLTARKARPLADDRMTVNLNTDLTVKGQASGPLDIAGLIHINRAEIRIPERMPTKIAVLKVIRPGAPPPPPPVPGPDVTLNLTMDAPREIFVRGRGLDSELGGKIHVRGTVAKPQPDGGFAMRRGQFSLAGQTLTFSKGEVGFDGGSLADPSLNFVASTTSGNVTATLTIGGTAGNPKIKLSSVPELPQDEVLARLLFGRSATTLSPLEMVQIASAVASLTGVTSGFGDPLESVRKNLGLDRLSIGGANPALEAGRYVAPGVYVGAKQGVTGTGTQATVQIDLFKGLKVEGTAGTGVPSSGASGTAGTNSVGVIYQHEY